MKVLHIAPSFYPATYFGGPIYSTYALCNALASRSEFDLKVLTTNSAGPRLRDSCEAGTIPASAGYPVSYCRRWLGLSFSPRLLSKLVPMIRWADVVHLTAVYSAPTIPTLLVCKLLNKPVVWSPRGSLQRWAGSSRDRFKRFWERVCDWLCDARRVTVHVTSESEQIESESRMKRVRVVNIPNGVELPEVVEAKTPRNGYSLRLLYMGRLDPIKGIENLLGAVQKCPGVSLSICGDSSTDYANSLKKLVGSLKLESRVQFHGHLTGTLRARKFSESDVLIMPSFRESFGMSAAEALSFGLPVIAGRATPWKNIETVGCGLWVDNDPETLADAIKRIGEMPLEEMGKKGRQWMAGEFSWERIGDRMANLYRDSLSRAKHD